MTRNELVASLARLLDFVSRRNDISLLLQGGVVDEVDQLRKLADPEDIEAWQLIGLVHYLRALLPPRPTPDRDLVAAVDAFAHLLPTAPHLVPPQVRDAMAHLPPGVLVRLGALSGKARAARDAAELNDQATRLVGNPPAAQDAVTLGRAVSLMEQAVAAVPADHPSRALYLSNLGAMLRERSAHTGALTDLDRAVEVGREAISATPVDHPRRADRLVNLGGTLLSRFQRKGDLVDLDQAIELVTSAVAAAANDPDRARHLSSLAAALAVRFQRTGELADLDRMLEIGTEVLEAAQPGDPSRDTYLSDVAFALLTRYGRTGDLTDLDRAVERGRQAAAVPADQPARGARLGWLAEALIIRFDRTGDLADLDEAVTTYSDAVAATAVNHPDHALYLFHLGHALRKRFQRTGTLADLERAVEAGHQAVSAAPVDHPHRAGALGRLSGTLLVRAMRTGDPSDLDQAIDCGRQALAATTGDDPNRAAWLSHLGLALYERSRRTGGLSDLDQAIEYGRQSLFTGDDRERPTALHNLGVTLCARYLRSSDVVDLDHGIEYVRQALDATASADPDRAARLSTLGGALRHRFNRLGELPDLEQAVEAITEAVAGTPIGHPDRGERLANLGDALRLRFERIGELGDLDRAVEVGGQAVAATPVDHHFHAAFLARLGESLRMRFTWTGELADLDRAIEAHERAVAAMPTDHAERPFFLSALGRALLNRYDRSEQPADIESAMEVFQQALAAVPADHRERANILSSLASGLLSRFQRTGTLIDLDRAIASYTQSLAATPPDDPSRADRQSGLGVALRFRFERNHSPADLDQGIELARAAISATPSDQPDRCIGLLDLGRALLTRFHHTGHVSDRDAALATFREGARMAVGAPTTRVWAGRDAARLAAAAREWSGAHDDLNLVLTLLPVLTDRRLSLSDRQHHLKHLQGLGADAARASLGDLTRNDAWAERVVAAWTQLEQARNILLSQVLETRADTTTLRRARPDLADEYDRLRHILNATVEEAGAAHGDAQIERRRQAAARWPVLLDEIRRFPGLERFALAPLMADLQAAVGSGTVVALVVTEHDCGALLLTGTYADYLALPDLSAQDALTNANAFIAAINGSPVDTATVRRVLAWLWDTVAGPVLSRLGHSDPPMSEWPRVWWIPTGALTVLPLHAAGHHDGPPQRRRAVLDRVVSSYTPSVRALAEACAAAGQPGIGGFAAGIDRVPGLPPLTKAEAEATAVARALRIRPLLGNDATHTAISQALPETAWAHFACHGVADHGDPSRSFLAMRDRPLRAGELFAQELRRPYLAFLSACTTAVGSVRLLDENISLAAAFQLAGFPHVIATMWRINDYVAADLAADFYQAVLPDPALALHQTVRRYRDDYPDSPQLWASHIHLGP